MNNKNKTSEVIFAITIGVMLAFALWWLIGGWVLPLTMCGVDNDKQCNSDFVNLLAVVISVGLSAILTVWKISKISKQKS